MQRKALMQYKKSRVNTRSRGRILLMLYDGAIRFLEQAKVAMDQNRPDLRGERISKTHAIVSELIVTLDHDVAPELCENLEKLYIFMLDQLLAANRHNDKERLDTVIELLIGLRDSWRVAVKEAEGKKSPSSNPSYGAASNNAPRSVAISG